MNSYRRSGLFSIITTHRVFRADTTCGCGRPSALSATVAETDNLRDRFEQKEEKPKPGISGFGDIYDRFFRVAVGSPSV